MKEIVLESPATGAEAVKSLVPAEVTAPLAMLRFSPPKPGAGRVGHGRGDWLLGQLTVGRWHLIGGGRWRCGLEAFIWLSSAPLHFTSCCADFAFLAPLSCVLPWGWQSGLSHEPTINLSSLNRRYGALRPMQRYSSASGKEAMQLACVTTRRPQGVVFRHLDLGLSPP